MRWKPAPSVCVVAAAAGYPDAPETGRVITGLANRNDGAVIFHAGTRREDDAIVTSGGRVLGITAGGPSLPEAIANTYTALRDVSFEGMQYRTDIGAKGLKRW